ncbi:MAG: MjaI family restriction endonuclease [Sedimentisphaerales bacterium]|nr:MjaI family restriction endonuclease [Sedimentisphaerales bacterium]
MKVRLTNEEIRAYLDIQAPEFPKYTTQLLNLANQNAQGTRPRVVGQMSELIQHFTGKTLHDWERWYQREKPDAIKAATEKVLQMVKNLREAIAKIDEEIIEQWIRDLVIVKTYMGLRFQEAILKKGAELKNQTYRLAEPAEEAVGADGFIGETPVSIKPTTYRVKAGLSETILVQVVFYEKTKNGLVVDYGRIVD